MVPGFYRDDVWTPAFAGVTDLVIFRKFKILRRVENEN